MIWDVHSSLDIMNDFGYGHRKVRSLFSSPEDSGISEWDIYDKRTDRKVGRLVRTSIFGKPGYEGEALPEEVVRQLKDYAEYPEYLGTV